VIRQRPLIESGDHRWQIQVTDDGSRTLVIAGSEDTFHSGCGAVAETRHVYLGNSGVTDRLAAGRATRVLEVGLGTGMGMLLTLQAATDGNAALDYVALETDWITAATFEFLNPRQWPCDRDLVDRYVDYRSRYPAKVHPGVYHWTVDPLRQVSIRVQDLRTAASMNGDGFDAIYFDPFCPETSPELWTCPIFRSLLPLIRPSGRLVTYSCSRPVRDALTAAGWDVRRVPGPEAGKREVLVAEPFV